MLTVSAMHPTRPHAERCRVLAGQFGAFTKALASLGVKPGDAGQVHVQPYGFLHCILTGKERRFKH
jgi:hypothetical protein